MVVIMHHPHGGGWEFTSRVGHLAGGGRNLEQCMDSAEHAARLYMTRRQGYEVLQDDARHEVRHAISCVPTA